MKPNNINSMIVGLTGGIGTGKSTVSARFSSLGACVIDADVVAREVVLPGSLGLKKILDEFGSSVLSENGLLDRKKLADLVFGDNDKLAVLNEILHPLIEIQIKYKISQCFESSYLPVIVVIPLLVETDARSRYGLDKVIVVDAPIEVVANRVLMSRSMTKDELDSRISAQASREQRLEIADYVIDNSQGVAYLENEISRVWFELTS